MNKGLYAGIWRRIQLWGKQTQIWTCSLHHFLCVYNETSPTGSGAWHVTESHRKLKQCSLSQLTHTHTAMWNIPVLLAGALLSLKQKLTETETETRPNPEMECSGKEKALEWLQTYHPAYKPEQTQQHLKHSRTINTYWHDRVRHTDRTDGWTERQMRQKRQTDKDTNTTVWSNRMIIYIKQVNR